MWGPGLQQYFLTFSLQMLQRFIVTFQQVALYGQVV